MPPAVFKSTTVGISGPQDFSSLVRIFIKIIDIALPILIGLALLAFFWGLVKFILRLGGDEKIEEGRSLMVWGLIALFVMISFVGILNFFYGDIFGGTLFLPILPTDATP